MHQLMGGAPMQVRTAILAIAGLFFCHGLQADHIDSFAVGPQSVTADSNNSGSGQLLSGLDSTEVLGGSRIVSVWGNMSSGSITAVVDTSGTGSLSFTSNSPAYTDDFKGELSITSIFGNRFETFDISAYSDQFYIVDVASADFGSAGPNFDASVGLTSAAGDASPTITFKDSTTPYSAEIPLSAFFGVDLSMAFNLILEIDNIPADANFTIDNIRFGPSTIPEPSTFVLLATLGLAAALRLVVFRSH
jgi:hypothetical protein